jgi:hypothetical protein
LWGRPIPDERDSIHLNIQGLDLAKSRRTFGSFEYLGPCTRHDDTSRAIKVKKDARKHYEQKLILTESDQCCLLLASQGLVKYGINPDLQSGINCQNYLEDCTKRMLVDRVGDIPRIETLSGTSIVATLAIAGFLYGGVHLAAWHTIFKTRIEECFWKISAISLTASGPLGVCAIFLVRSWKIEWEADMSIGRFLLTALLMFILPAVIAVYVVARVYLIAESFINLMFLDESIFFVSNWLQYFPHITSVNV